MFIPLEGACLARPDQTMPRQQLGCLLFQPPPGSIFWMFTVSFRLCYPRRECVFMASFFFFF